MNEVQLLIPVSARTAHDELFKTLRDADNPAAWMVFMETVTRLLPDVLSSGRPTKESIQKSAIGQLGFNSWQEMIEAPADQNGLAWNFSAWKAWRRAWSTVQTNPWLKDQKMTSSEVNTLANEFKGSDFPDSREKYEELKKERKELAEKRRTDTVAALKKRLEDAEKLAIQAQAKADALDIQLEKSRLAYMDQGQQIATLKTLLEEAQKPPVKLTRWEHLKAFLIG